MGHLKQANTVLIDENTFSAKEDAFLLICKEVLNHEKQNLGIGTLSEKTVHAVLKSYYCPNPIYQEQKVCGFIADIFDGQHIIEIQTRNFNNLRKKLDVFLPNYPVTIVYPIAHTKWLRWIEQDTGEISPPRKSPKSGSKYEVFYELYRIKPYLSHPNLHFKLVLLDLYEYRFLNGYNKNKKKGSSRCDSIPISLAKEVLIDSISDYSNFLPESLERSFSVKDYKTATKLSLKRAGIAVHILNYLGVIKKIGKRGNAYIYERK